MGNSAKKIIGRNVRQIRKSLGLSRHNFSILTGLSKGTVYNIEHGNSGYNINLIDSITNFTKYSLQDISKADFKPSIALREKLINLYAKQIEFTKILTGIPEINYAINYKLLVGDFLETPKEISEIRVFFEKQGWYYKGTSLSNALKKIPEFIEIRKHESKGNTNLYLKK